jgi:hypothetical protein
MKNPFKWLFSVLHIKLTEKHPATTFAPANFKQDTECLFSVVSTFIENERFKITIAQKKILSDSDLVEIANVVTFRTISTLSGDYKALLQRYFSKEELTTFISEIVVRNVVQLGLDVNRKVV